MKNRSFIGIFIKSAGLRPKPVKFVEDLQSRPERPRFLEVIGQVLKYFLQKHSIADGTWITRPIAYKRKGIEG
jgi:hypothetical protein